MERDVRSITPEAMKKLLAYNWPGNVQELENSIQRGVLLAEGQTIGVEHLPPHLVLTSGITGTMFYWLFHERGPEDHGIENNQQDFAGNQR